MKPIEKKRKPALKKRKKVGRPKEYKLRKDMEVGDQVMYSGKSHPLIAFRREAKRLGFKLTTKLLNRGQGGNKVYSVKRSK